MSERFREFVKGRGLRYTAGREAILRGALGLWGHFDPEGLLAAARRHSGGVSTASVYRTIPLLLECGIIQPVETSGRHSRYELARGHHDHMLCVGCGRVIEFFSPELESLQDELCAERSFRGTAHTLEIKGYCKRCGGAKGRNA
jgi:Fur family ferric uptake transcriptional regulator